MDGYLSFWAAHNREILANVPADRLLIVRTHEIQDDIERMAKFLAIPAETLDRSQAHQYGATRQYGILAKIDRDFLEEKVDLHCRDLMDQYFPEVRRLSDAVMAA